MTSKPLTEFEKLIYKPVQKHSRGMISFTYVEPADSDSNVEPESPESAPAPGPAPEAQPKPAA